MGSKDLATEIIVIGSGASPFVAMASGAARPKAIVARPEASAATPDVGVARPVLGAANPDVGRSSGHDCRCDQASTAMSMTRAFASR